MSIDPKIKQELQDNLDSLLKYRKSRRSQEDIITDITELLSNIKKDTFLPFVLQMMNSIQFRDSLEAFKNLKSPLQQFAYLIDLFFSKHHTETEDAPDEKEWNRLTELLDEVEMNYFGEIGFFDENTGDLQLDKITVSLKSFFDYYANGQLSFDEQTIYRIKTNFSKFDEVILSEYGFQTDDIIKFSLSVNIILQEKADRCFFLPPESGKMARINIHFC